MICNFLRSKGEKWLTVCSFHIKNRRGAGGGNPLRLRKGLRGGACFDEVRANIERPESNCGA